MMIHYRDSFSVFVSNVFFHSLRNEGSVFSGNVWKCRIVLVDDGSIDAITHYFVIAGRNGLCRMLYNLRHMVNIYNKSS